MDQVDQGTQSVLDAHGQAHRVECMLISRRVCGDGERAAVVSKERLDPLPFPGLMHPARQRGVSRRRHPQRRFPPGLSTPETSATLSKTDQTQSGASHAPFSDFSRCHKEGKERFKILFPHLCRRGTRHRLQPRLGGQRHRAVGYQIFRGAQLRAHPSQPPHRHGRACAAVEAGRVVGDPGRSATSWPT